MTSRRPPPWRVVAATFETSAPHAEACPASDRPELAICGRSNVGKSSLLNALCGQRGLARTSRTPGRTQLLNCFAVELAGPDTIRASLRIVDLPGYGFAAAGRPIRDSFAPMVEGYLQSRASLCALLILVDVRRGIGDDDLSLVEYAQHNGWGAVVVGTKADKLGASQRGLCRDALLRKLPQGTEVVVTSATSGLGLPRLAAALAAAVGDPPP